MVTLPHRSWSAHVERYVSKNAAVVLLEMIASTILIEVAAPLSFIARIFPDTKLFLSIWWR